MRSNKYHKPQPPGYLSISNYRKATGLSQSAIYNRLQKKQIKSVKLGGHYFIPLSEILPKARTQLDVFNYGYSYSDVPEVY